ncbi:MAG TPA: restriction endonuclease subunit S [Candidatus Nanopelagicales bacterium]|nr:restriction endonuclease subunit S [Candidatus Nanopelagicales bacterium]
MRSLPTGWVWSTVAEVGKVELGRQRHPNWHTGPNMRPYLRVANVFENRIDVSDLKEMDFTGVFDRFKLHPGDVLLNEGQTPELLGRPAIYRGQPENVAFTNSLIRFQAGPKVTPGWALLVFRHHMHSGRFKRESRITTNIAHLSATRLKTVEFPVPPMDQQRRIVETLEGHLSHLDAADADLRRAQSARDTLLLSALRSHVHSVRSTGAPFAPIGDLAATSLGKMLDAKKTTGNPTPYLANINVRWGRFDLDNLKSVPLTSDERSRLALMRGDVIVCEGGEPGRCAVWEIDDSNIAYQKALHRVRIHDPRRISPYYLALMIREAVQSGRADQLFTGTTIKHLPQEKLRLLEVPLPDFHEQIAALTKLSDLDSSCDRLDAALQAARLRSSALRRAVIAAAFEGNLTGRHTDTDIIEELAHEA